MENVSVAPARARRGVPAPRATKAICRPLSFLIGQIKDPRRPHGRRVAQIDAGNMFLVRVLSTLIALGTQVLLARWLRRFEFEYGVLPLDLGADDRLGGRNGPVLDAPVHSAIH